MVRTARRLGVLIAAIAAVAPATAAFASPTVVSNANKVYNSLSPGATSADILGGEVFRFGQLGNEITLTRAGTLASVQVTMASAACQSGWIFGDCVSSPGATFSMPITLNLYDAPASDPTAQPDSVGSGLPGALITSITQTFNIPYRPSHNDAKCTGADLGDWFDRTTRQCLVTLKTNISFNIGSLHVAVPKTIVYGIAYNTSDNGAAPYGDSNACNFTVEGCPYDWLSIGFSQDPVNLQRGTDTYPGTIWWDTQIAADYCDYNGSTSPAGTGVFRIDSPSTTPCFGANPFFPNDSPWLVPAVQFVGAPPTHISVTGGCVAGGSVTEHGAAADGATQWDIEPIDLDETVSGNPSEIDGLLPGPYTYVFLDADSNYLTGGTFTIPVCV